MRASSGGCWARSRAGSRRTGSRRRGARRSASAPSACPGAHVDWITLGLLVLALVPWLGPLLKSIELPGGLKLEFRELMQSGQRVERAGLVAAAAPADAPEVGLDDPKLALAWLRVEIEKRLRALASAHGLAEEDVR